MSRPKHAARKRRRALPRERDEGRLALARHRRRLAKTVLGAGAVAGFVIWMMLARATYAGHAKHPVRALSIPQPLYQVVRRNLLQAGIVAPATAPPDATTSTS